MDGWEDVIEERMMNGWIGGCDKGEDDEWMDGGMKYRGGGGGLSSFLVGLDHSLLRTSSIKYFSEPRLLI